MSGNTFVDTEVRIDGAVTANVLGHSTNTIRPHGVRVDLHSDAKPAAQAVLGAKLDWKIKVDGSVQAAHQAGLQRPRRRTTSPSGPARAGTRSRSSRTALLVRTVVVRF